MGLRPFDYSAREAIDCLTRQEAIKKDARGFHENREAAIEGGTAAGDARHAYEERTGDKVVTDQNFKGQIAAAKKKDDDSQP